MARQLMPISSRWFQAAVLTYVIGFGVLGALAYLVYRDQPPVPAKIMSGERVLFTGDDVLSGMNVFQRYGLMEYGSIYGHGAYLGPDFTAEYLHITAEYLINRYRNAPGGRLSAQERVAAEFHENGYDRRQDVVAWSSARAEAHRMMEKYYGSAFATKSHYPGVGSDWISSPDEIRALTAFFAWTAWTATADRPGTNHSYTNNWPPEPLAGNTITAGAVTWSVISIIGLLGGAGLVLYFFGRYDWLGWSGELKKVNFRSVADVALTRSQKAVVWFFLVSSLLFLIQTLTGGLIAHYRAEPAGFFGVDLRDLLPFNIARTWHVQLAIFWVSASYLATGIFIVPLIAGRERRGQSGLTLLLLIAVAIVVFGSLAGEYAGVKGWLGSALWFWIGHQGWEYLDLGRLWQILLIVGLFFWVLILLRGLSGTLREQHFGNMPWMFFYAALAIPAFYAVGLLAGPRKGFVVNDFWRFWVVHLWVEDFLELFTTVMVAYMFVLLGVVRQATALRIIYLDIILYSLGVVIGTMHHLYFSGTPVAHLAMGATFSAMEVIPLLLLTLEAWGFIRSGEKSTPESMHVHRWAVWFLVAVGFWNFLGAGVFGFLINLPVVSYYEIGTSLTANHGHTAMMGVYGMLAIGLMLFCLRYLTQPDHWSDSAAKLSFWSLNIGLTWMAFLNLFPVGIVQLYRAVDTGYWRARSPEFVSLPWVNKLEWARLPGDALFIVGGAVPILWICWQAIRHPNPRLLEPDTEVTNALFVYSPERQDR